MISHMNVSVQVLSHRLNFFDKGQTLKSFTYWYYIEVKESLHGP